MAANAKTKEKPRSAKRGRSFAIIGLGSFGGMVAQELARFDNDVIGLDRDAKVAARFSETLSEVAILDSRDEAALREAGVADCDVAVICMASDLEASVLTAVNLKMISVPEVWAKAETRAQHRILSKIGVDRILHPEEDMGRHTAQMLHNPLVRDYASLGNGYHVVNMIVPEELDGRKLGDLKLLDRFDLRCVGVMRGAEFLGAERGTDGEDIELACEDRMLVLGNRQNLRRFASSL